LCSDPYGKYTIEVRFYNGEFSDYTTTGTTEITQCSNVSIGLSSERDLYYTNESGTFQAIIQNTGNVNLTNADLKLSFTAPDGTKKELATETIPVLNIGETHRSSVTVDFKDFEQADYSLKAAVYSDTGLLINSAELPVQVRLPLIFIKAAGLNIELVSAVLGAILAPFIYLLFLTLYPVGIISKIMQLPNGDYVADFKVKNRGLLNLKKVSLEYEYDPNYVRMLKGSKAPAMSEVRRGENIFEWEVPLRRGEHRDLSFTFVKLVEGAKIPKIKIKYFSEIEPKKII
jgi:hypothetical protein